MKPSTLVSLSLVSAGLVLCASPGRGDDTANPPAPPPAPASPPATPGEGSVPAPTPSPQGRMRMRGMWVLSELTEKLSLTADQQKSVGALIKSGQSQMQAVRGDDSYTKEGRRTKMRAITGSTREQILALLTPDQQKLFEAMPPGGARPRNPDNN